MSPEERAEAAIKTAQGMLNLQAPTAESIHRDFVTAIASALRQAENDALERAAVAAEGKGDRWGTMRDDLYNEGCQDAAKAIRALKHQE